MMIVLPAQKHDFPKFLYLDQNKWIDLARAYYGRDRGEPFADALTAVNAAVAAGRLVVPISGVHVMETMAPADDERRRRTAQFLVHLSGNQALLPYMSIRPLEILHATLRVLGRAPATSVRTALVRSGLHYALGGEAEITGVSEALREVLMRELVAPETSVQMLVEAADRAMMQQARREDLNAVVQLEETRRRARATMDEEMCHRVELAELFSRGEPGRELIDTLRGLGLTSGQLFEHFQSPDDYMRFFHDVPTIDVFVTLGLARDRDLARPIDRNDLKDISFMAVAVPYANIVIAERFWTHHANASGLAVKYQTTVRADARDLPELLRVEGCID